MKITLDLPDELVSRIEARAALEGRSLGELTAALYRSWLEESSDAPARGAGTRGLERWLAEAPALTGRAAPGGPDAQTLLDEGRDRLHRS